MIRSLIFACLTFLAINSSAANIIVKNIDELNEAAKNAQPGDIITLQNGVWNNVTIKLECKGTAEKPITIKAQTAGKVLINGESCLKLGGMYTVVDGLYFTNGYSGKNTTIEFRSSKDNLANNCRVTNTVIDNFNNPKRMDENNWVLFYGKNNRIDHCSFRDKNNMGVLMAVILDDDRSRANFHSVDHNYFGRRIPLGSNGGEIIRVGVSQHCEFNSNTQITDNFFEECDGEAEIISIKSCSNVIRGNFVRECQGSIVLRHGNYNTVENNVILGNGKPGTGGIRVINKGQWVINNFLSGCRGIDFRSPLTVMNGIPNSPAHRYVQVTDAVIMGNTFANCSPISLCDGSDAERSLPPANTIFADNLFYNTMDTSVYRSYDNTNGFLFLANVVSTQVKQKLPAGFFRPAISTQKYGDIPFPVVTSIKVPAWGDSLQAIAKQRLNHDLKPHTGFADLRLAQTIEFNARTGTGAPWFKQSPGKKAIYYLQVSAKNAEEVYKLLERKEPMSIALTGKQYILDKPFAINKPVRFTGDKKLTTAFSSNDIPAIFELGGNGHLVLSTIFIHAGGVQAKYFIANSKEGLVDHYSLSMQGCTVQELRSEKGCEAFFYAYKSMMADSVMLRGNYFTGNNVAHIVMNDEKDDKGLYGAEKILLDKNTFSKEQGLLLDLYRGGTDESTLGPQLVATGNSFRDCSNSDEKPFIALTGVQRSQFSDNVFMDCFTNTSLFVYTDKVRAYHTLEKNVIRGCGKIQTNNFVIQKDNNIQ
jgi:poly(beta-D-mannuronate) lyase